VASLRAWAAGASARARAAMLVARAVTSF